MIIHRFHFDISKYAIKFHQNNISFVVFLFFFVFCCQLQTEELNLLATETSYFMLSLGAYIVTFQAGIPRASTKTFVEQ